MTYALKYFGKGTLKDETGKVICQRSTRQCWPDFVFPCAGLYYMHVRTHTQTPTKATTSFGQALIQKHPFMSISAKIKHVWGHFDE